MLRVFDQYLTRRKFLLIVSENLLILVGIQAAAFLRAWLEGGTAQFDNLILLKSFVITLVCQLCLYFNDLYDLRVVKDSRELYIRLLQAMGACAILVALIYLFIPFLFLGEGVFLFAVWILLGGLILWRIVFSWFNRLRQLKEPLLILGTSDLARKLVAEILDRPDIALHVVGFISTEPELVGQSLVNPAVLGTTEEFREIVAREQVDRVAVAMPDSRGKMPVADLLELKLQGTLIEDATFLYERITGKIAVENLRPSYLVFSEGFRKSWLTLLLKRFSGLLLSLVGLILVSPLMFLIAILIKLDSRGPVLYKQERVGENGKTFNLLKFRSMTANAEAESGPVWAAANDSRVTRIGRIMRKTRLDELPQFINVLRGDLNFVGPRPERPHFVKQLVKEIPYYNLRHTIKPGLTGWAQVCYQYGASVEDAIEKLQYDLYYTKHMSIALDALIVFQTIKIVLLRRGAH